MAFKRCDYCGLGFDTSFGPDVNRHNHLHRKYQEVEAELGFIPAQYEEREKSKRDAYEGMHPSNTQEFQVRSALLLLKAHYDRSLASAIDEGYWSKHPSFEEYISMSSLRLIPDEIIKILREKYGQCAEGIPDGETDWYPKRSNARKLQKARVLKRKNE